MSRTTADLAAIYDAIEGPDPSDEFCSTRDAASVSPVLDQGVGGLRIAIADGYFLEHIESETRDAVMSIAEALGVRDRVTLPHVDAGRSCATVITAVEGAGQHLATLRERPQDFDPMTRDRFLAGALLPGSVYQRAQASRRFYRDAVKEIFQARGYPDRAMHARSRAVGRTGNCRDRRQHLSVARAYRPLCYPVLDHRAAGDLCTRMRPGPATWCSDWWRRLTWNGTFSALPRILNGSARQALSPRRASRRRMRHGAQPDNS